MKLTILAVALTTMLSGCNAARTPGHATGAPDAGKVGRGLDAAAAVVAAQCATLDDVLVRLTVDSVARITGNTRRIERLRAERREVCAEAEARQAAIAAETLYGDAAPTP